MSETEYTALVFGGNYVDANLLNAGIYLSLKPFIFQKNETIESLIEQGRAIKDKMGVSFISEDYFDNLKQCQLVKIKIEIQP